MSSHLSDPKSSPPGPGWKPTLKRAWANPYGKVLIPAASALVLSLVAFSLDQRIVGLALSAPVAVYFGLAFAGHLVTIDDDMPGEWSNPEESRPIWYLSLLEMFAKFLLFAAVGIYVAMKWEV